MKNVGIICEFNPFTDGHRRLFDAVRSAGADRIICVMSGNCVQRGEPALMPAYYRARAAAECGADAVFELPYPFCAASAPFFAAAGVKILAGVGVTAIAFGSECADLSVLRELAAKKQFAGVHAPEGTAAGISGGVRTAPNDILAAEYIRAAASYMPEAELIAVKRTGAGYLDTGFSCDMPSASAVRAAIRAGSSYEGIPGASRDAVGACCAEGMLFSDFDLWEKLCLAFLRTADPQRLALCAECGGGVSGRLISAAAKCSKDTTLRDACATKKYTDARLRRAVIFGMTGVTEPDLRLGIPYVRMLAANASGREFVRDSQREGGIQILTKPSKHPADDASERIYRLSSAFDSLYSLLLPACPGPGVFAKMPPYII